MVDLGYIALFLAFLVAAYSAVAFVVGFRKQSPHMLESARNGVIGVCALMTVATAIMLYALFAHDFGVEYVYNYTSTDLHWSYTLSALWAGNKGSLLFWGWILSVLSAIMVLQKRDFGRELVPYASAVAMVTQLFFLVLMLWVANPFSRLAYSPVEGAGLNPLLENPGMLIHPPTLLFGYAGFTIPFGFAIAALLTGRLGDEWIRMARRWTLIPWLVLGVGNLAGSWWAYYVLGWGGYWAWDPVENAGLLPWLVATAFLHSIMMQRRRGMLRIWNMVLIILSFVLSIFGTFLTRSGVLASVHAFGDSAMGPFFVAFIVASLFVGVGLLYYRSGELKSEAEMESLLSRESTFLLNNLLLVGVAFATFLGTIFPVISEAVTGVKITVGPPFFNQVNTPIFMATILITGVCTVIGWRRASARNLQRNLLGPAIAAVIVAIALVVFGVRQPIAVGGIFLCSFVVFSILYEWLRGTTARHRMKSENYLKAFFGLVMANRPRYGGYLVHLAVMIAAIGIIVSSMYGVSKEATLKSGESIDIGNYSLTYGAADRYSTATKSVVITSLSVRNSGTPIGRIMPQKTYQTEGGTVTTAAVRSTLFEDLYVILIDVPQDGSGTASFKVLVNPFVNWIWIGGAIFVFGGLLAFWPERRREPAVARRED